MRLRLNTEKFRRQDMQPATRPGVRDSDGPGALRVTAPTTEERATGEAARAIVEPRVVPQLFAELSHDLRQPLTTIKMNLQSAIRLLEGPHPRVDAAVEALTDCLLSESAMVDLLAEAQRRVAQMLSPDGTFSLNGLVHDLILAVHTFVPHCDIDLREQLDETAPVVEGSPWRLRMILLTVARRLLIGRDCQSPNRGTLVFETHGGPLRAELVITGFTSSAATIPAMQPLLAILEATAHRMGGFTSLEAGDEAASLRIFLPLASRIMSPRSGGPYGD